MKTVQVKEIDRAQMRIGDLLKLRIYGRNYLTRALFLGSKYDSWQFLIFDNNSTFTLREIPSTGKWVIINVYLEARHEESDSI